MAEQNTIPAEMLDAVFEAVGKRLFPTNWHFVLSSPSCQEYADTRWLAYHALEAANVPALLAERAEQQASSDLRWRADQRARERWQAAHPDQPQKWPDHTDLCVWLMAELETALTAAERGKGDL